MAGCIFRASGEHFAVNAFLAVSSLTPDTVWHRGEPVQRNRSQLQTSGFSVVVSNSWGVLPPQIDDALVFLRTHEYELARLRQIPAVTDLRLDFAYERRQAPFQCDTLPHQLLLTAGSLGISIELSLYPCEDDFENVHSSE